MEQEKISLHGESTFVLIHGAWGCSSVWDQVELYLRRLGHRTVAVDLPGHGRDRSDIRLQSTKTYTEKVKRVIEEIVEPVILVGHSMGGSVISAVGEAVPERVEKLVYCAAFLLDYGESGNGTDGSGIQPVDWYPYSDDGKSVSWEAYQRQNPTSMGNARYVSAEDLVREEKVMKGARESIAALCGKVYPTGVRWGGIPRYYVFTEADRAITPDLQERMLQKLPCEKVYRLFSDHFPQSAASLELSLILHEISRDKPGGNAE